jgi:hypothetical protein
LVTALTVLWAAPVKRKQRREEIPLNPGGIEAALQTLDPPPA